MTDIRDASAIIIGNGILADAVYAGSNQVWPPPPPPAPVFRSRTSQLSGGTGINMNIPIGTQAGDVMIGAIAHTRGNSASFTESMPGWTQLGWVFQANGLSGLLLSIWGKVASASESTGGYSQSGLGTSGMKHGMVESWTGVDGLPDFVTPNSTTGGGAQSLSSNTVTPVPNAVILTWLGVRSLNTGVDPSWGGGAVAAYSTDSGQISNLYNATEIAADTDAVTHDASFTNNQAPAIQAMGSIVLKPAA